MLFNRKGAVGTGGGSLHGTSSLYESDVIFITFRNFSGLRCADFFIWDC